jgi:hypothetical protein
MTKTKPVTQRTFVDPRSDAPDDAGWRFVEQPQPSVRRRPSLSWRLRH